MTDDVKQDGLAGQSSRIFVKGLPLNLTDADFRKHFSANGREITDIKLVAKRGFGFVGYKSPEAAAKAVRYFNRTYIRMSKLLVEIARPLSETWNVDGSRKDEHVVVDAKSEQTTKKRKREEQEGQNPRLKEYLQVMQHGNKGVEDSAAQEPAIDVPDAESDGEYDSIPKVEIKNTSTPSIHIAPQTVSAAKPEKPPDQPAAASDPTPANATDDDWLRSRTNRLLDLMDVDEIQEPKSLDAVLSSSDSRQPREPPPPNNDILSIENNTEPATASDEAGNKDSELEKIQETSRLYVRNLPYSTTEHDLAEHFALFGELVEAHLPVNKLGASKGFAFVQYVNSSDAIKAFQTLDGATFQGRNLHVLPGEGKKTEGLDEFAISQLPLKQQNQIRQKAEAAKKSFSWNSLYMSQDAVTASVATRLGVSKSEVLDPTSSDAAVKQAIAETSIIQETKTYFTSNGVDLDAFKSQKRGDTEILVKNFPHGTTMEELRSMFEEHGTVSRVLMPPSGTIAIVQFRNATEGKIAFQALAFRRFKNSILFLEKGPAGLIRKDLEPSGEDIQEVRSVSQQKLSVTELLEREDDGEYTAASLFVKNLNFNTTTDKLAEVFKPLDGFVSAVVKTKTDPKKPGQVLSMGFGFVEFKSKGAAEAALKVMDSYVLDGHKLAIKVSHKGHDAAEERRREDKAKKLAGQKTKVVIKNLPFEATKKDVRTLFGTYGKLRAVRVPKKFGMSSSRGFAFAEFVTPREAENALNALQHTHLLGRRLVLGFAEAEAVDPEEEIEKMQRKIGRQVNKVTLQQLTGGGRKKVSLGEENEDDL